MVILSTVYNTYGTLETFTLERFYGSGVILEIVFFCANFKAKDLIAATLVKYFNIPGSDLLLRKLLPGAPLIRVSHLHHWSLRGRPYIFVIHCLVCVALEQ